MKDCYSGIPLPSSRRLRRRSMASRTVSATVAQRDPGELDEEDGLPIATLSRDEHQS